MAKKKKGNATPNAHEIAALAYRMYEQEGCQDGRDREHWLQAEMLLKNPAEDKMNSASNGNSLN